MRDALPLALKHRVRPILLGIQGPRCFYCRRHLVRNPPRRGRQVAATMTIDHIVPRVRGGAHNLGNLCLCCHQCNQSKAGRPWWEWAWPIEITA